MVNRANGAVGVFRRVNALVKRDALAGRAESFICLREEIETLDLVKDIFAGYGMGVQIEPRIHRAWYQRLML